MGSKVITWIGIINLTGDDTTPHKHPKRRLPDVLPGKPAPLQEEYVQ